MNESGEPGESAQPLWHAADAAQVLADLGSGPEGLSEAEARERLTRHGPNRLPQAQHRGLLARVASQFHDVLIYVLLAAAALSAAIGHGVDALVILGVVIINAAIGLVQEGRAQQALEAIRGMIDPRASVVREGRRISIAAEQIVPGDLVLLEAGDRVAADLRLMRARNLRIEEAALTGESIAVEKQTAPVTGTAPLGDRTSMAFSGTFVAAGQGAGIAIGTGTRTELGRISTLLDTVESLQTPLLRQIGRFARQLTGVVLIVSAAMLLFAYWVRSYPLAEAFMIVVGLAVAAIPEGLPAVMTITLAIGVQRMAARNAIIRRLPAVETLGAVSIICSDKTGTLTRNEMTVSNVVSADGAFEVTGSGYRPHGALQLEGRDVDTAQDPVLKELMQTAVLCNDAALRQTADDWIVDGDPMEGALLSLAAKAGVDAQSTRRELPRMDEIPFDAAHRFMATLHHSQTDGAFACIKGAPECIVAMCDRQQTAGGLAAVDAPWWHERMEFLGAKGQRVIGMAVKRLPPDKQNLTFEDLQGGAQLLGLVGLMDPPREEAIAAVRDCRAAGIRPIMITGDHAATAAAIAKQLGFGEHPLVATGQSLEGLDAAQLRRLVSQTTVFARTSPEHKLRLVEALQAEGAVVAMTGDGVNDAPALKRADVGVAMGGKGTEVAKEAAEMVLADDNFASIVAAVREGRTVYDNLKKVISWTLPTNGGEACAIIVAILFGLTLPVTAVQILWVNMITAVALGLPLAFEPTEPGAMQRAPRNPGEPLLTGKLMWRIGFVSLLFALGVFGVFYWALARGSSLETARTLAVNTLVVMEIAYLFNVRFVHGTSLTWRGALGTPAVLISLAAVTMAQLAFTYAPFLQTMLQTRPLGLLEGTVTLAVGAALFAAVEIEKRVLRP